MPEHISDLQLGEVADVNERSTQQSWDAIVLQIPEKGNIHFDYIARTTQNIENTWFSYSVVSLDKPANNPAGIDVIAFR